MVKKTQEGVKKAPTSTAVRKKIITRIGPNGEVIEEEVYLDDQGNIVREEDLEE